MEKEAFVYCWTDHLRNMLYIGYHKGSLDDGYVCSSKLMKEQYKERPSDFTREIIAQGSKEDMVKFERKILVSMNAKDDESCYNQQNNAGTFRCKGHTEETKRKISEKLKGRKTKPFTKEHREKIGKGNKGKVRTEEHKRITSETSKGRRVSEETKKILSIKNKNPSEETRKKLSESGKKNKGKPKSEEHKRKLSEVHKGKKSSEETKQKMKQAHKKRPKILCPHCSKFFDFGNSKKSHFDNCRYKKVN